MPPADPIDLIMEVAERAFDPAYGEAWNRRQVSDAILLGTCRYMLATPSGRLATDLRPPVAGFYLARSVLDEDELLLLAVAPEFRGHGIGAALLDDFIASARARGAQRVFLEMRRGNPAEQLYRQHGFHPVGERRAYYRGSDGRRHDAISFARELSDT